MERQVKGMLDFAKNQGKVQLSWCQDVKMIFCSFKFLSTMWSSSKVFQNAIEYSNTCYMFIKYQFYVC